ncbi:MAG: oxygen-independent coproporphyrinogen III oxidase [Gammaproteobacteria bacterium]|nr:MAG: oxygen-independent coproporphyrinogen III oxidase [Gammaproteobacteria bacterium]
MAQIELDRDLIRRYDKLGPRYTSYPTAMEFTEDLDDIRYARLAQMSNDDPIPKSLSLYVHIPFCRALCYYCACTKIITRHPEKAEVYVDYLCREIELQGGLFDRDRRVSQLHWGGGTPTFLNAEQMNRVMGALEKSFSLSQDESREFSIEVDPRTVNEEIVEHLAGLGFNRISMGIQDLDADVQRAINRVQSAADTFAVFDAARACGFRSVAVDLIYGLPRQTVAGMALTLYRLMQRRPDRIALYSYAHLPHMFKAQRLIKDAELPGADTKMAIFERAVDLLTEAGYVYIGMDHFALPEDELVTAQERGDLQRNFQGYSTHADTDLIGLGVSSIGKIGDSYAQNQKYLNGYYAALDNDRLPIWRGVELSPDDRLRREIIHQLMCYGKLEMKALSDRYGINFQDYFSDDLERLQGLAADHLVETGPGSIEVTPKGRLLLRAIAMNFDAYRRQPGAAKSFSRVV